MRAPFRIRLPHPLLLLLGGVVAAAVCTWLLPAGSFERRADAASGRELVIPGTYGTIAATPVGAFQTILAVPRGMAAGADVLITILFVGAAFAMLERTGALGRLVEVVVQRSRRPQVVLVGVTLAFATFGALENMQEEIVALIPTLLVLSRGLGFGPLTALSVSVGGAAVGSAFGPTNPFQTGIALRFAELPPFSQPVLRTVAFVLAVTVWCGWVVYGAAREAREVARAGASSHAPSALPTAPLAGGAVPIERRDLLLLLLAVVPFAPYVYGVLQWEWGFHELSALFLVASYAIGLTAGFSLAACTEELIAGMKAMLPATIYVGTARAIGLVLADGHVLDTIIHGLSLPLQVAPPVVAPLLMIPVQALMHVVVPSVSGQATLTMPIMAPLAELVGAGRDAAVLAFQTGAGLADALVPTNGAVLAMLAAAGVSVARWWRFAGPGLLLVALVGAAAVWMAA
ncbi:Na+/H+ antiporter NhaC family protein [Gemmatimonas sp.]|uniref:Na+/H+ antiporter NhaC family protein n=1 Tax=Gemmatimonas sp. TaxID=1962908 RepID=UPI0025BCE07C|nr:Na+/H+ antiporter NhaC family protein [Gemmatimonas sp.]MCA2990763.1 YfcC family protein [Gemmatimonas sp.]